MQLKVCRVKYAYDAVKLLLLKAENVNYDVKVESDFWVSDNILKLAKLLEYES